MDIRITLDISEIEVILIKHLQAIFPQHIVKCTNAFELNELEFEAKEPQKKDRIEA